MSSAVSQARGYSADLSGHVTERVAAHRLLSVLLVTTALMLSGCSLIGKQEVQREQVTYQVARGDRLQKVGVKFGIPARALQSFNGISDPRSLREGQVLKIPAVGPLAGDASFQSVALQSSADRGASNRQRMVSIREVRRYLGKLKAPVEQARYTSSFGWRWGRFHEGMDLAAKEGEKVLASHDGVVVFVSESHGRYGKMVVVKGEKLLTVYGHNSANRVGIGDQVKRGDWIADVGSTGNATGPHLHLETRVLDENGRWAAVDPVIFYKRSTSPGE